MKIGELKEPYLSLAVQICKQNGGYKKVKEIHNTELFVAFVWKETPQGTDFWYDVYTGLTPEIPKQ